MQPKNRNIMPANKNAVTGYYIIDKLLDNSHSSMENGYGYVSILSEGTQKHLHLGRGRDVVLSFDRESIDGKYIVI